ncbi:unnamed protein product [Prorocentrum cordatum]|uniref:Uncharacterized protein n=1 Tax=Prorocentrum cordatum TaxID=2364126 RepID=A0ABN9YGR8_9DINO|nr:unnamed protein product [Polarella glacialis]
MERDLPDDRQRCGEVPQGDLCGALHRVRGQRLAGGEGEHGQSCFCALHAAGEDTAAAKMGRECPGRWAARRRLGRGGIFARLRRFRGTGAGARGPCFVDAPSRARRGWERCRRRGCGPPGHQGLLLQGFPVGPCRGRQGADAGHVRGAPLGAAGGLEDVAKLYEAASQRVDELQAEVEAEEREPGEAMPVRHRGKGQSPAEELLGGALDLWAATLQQCRREVDDEGDLEPPESAELGAFASAGLAEFHAGSLFLRVTIVRLWRHVFQHLAQERIALCDCLDAGARARVIAATQGASLDQRSERLRRPALELAAALARDAAPRGGREALRQGCGDDVAEARGGDAMEGREGVREPQVPVKNVENP